MSTSPPFPGVPRPAEAVNADIRALMQRAGGVLRAEDRPAYQLLVDEWNAAMARKRALGDMATAA
ncbi:hypothetical protein ACIPWE_38835 [Streptomyces sp. NPDC090073]|uniref:hypothetical protein n=1 Tax=Streptomyces sp. NPDC090073 TaxID=3365936 RepID=UPI00380661EF